MGSIKDSARGTKAVAENGLLSNRGGETTVTFPAFFNNAPKAPPPPAPSKSPVIPPNKTYISTKQNGFQRIKHGSLNSSLQESEFMQQAANKSFTSQEPLVANEYQQPIRVQSVLQPTREHHIQLNLDVAATVTNKDSQEPHVEFQHIITKNSTYSREVSLPQTPTDEQEPPHYQSAQWTNAKNRVMKFGDQQPPSTLKKQHLQNSPTKHSQPSNGTSSAASPTRLPERSLERQKLNRSTVEGSNAQTQKEALIPRIPSVKRPKQMQQSQTQ